MLYNVASSFVKIDEKQGIIQNASSGNSIEVSDEATTDSGIILKPGDSLSFNDTDIYVRTIGNKSSAVRVVPFVQSFGAASNSNSASSDEKITDYTSIVIHSITPEGKPRQEIISYVNPAKTKKELSTFGEMLIGSTVNTYKSTYRIDKVCCDLKAIVDLPFTENLIDRAGNTWIADGNPAIQDGKLYLDGASSISTADVNLQDIFNADFSLGFYMNYMDYKTNEGGFFTFALNNSIGWQTYNSYARFNARMNGSWLGWDIVDLSQYKNSEHHFAISRKDNTMYFFFDGVLKKTYSAGTFSCNEQKPLYIGRRVNYRTKMYMREFKIYSEGLWTETFTPE